MRSVSILCAGNVQAYKRLRRALAGYGYKVLTTATGHDAVALAAHHMPNLVILDTDLEIPLRGLEICRDLREWYSAPIVFLSARKDTHTKIVALNVGADDYITTPFDMNELEARIRAILRRTASKDKQTPTAELRVDEFRFDLAKRRVFLCDREIHFTPTEYHILRLLAMNAGKVLTYGELLGEMQQRQLTRPVHNLRVYVNTIRKKLGETVDRPHYIFTLPGIGYRFADIPAYNS